jgi:serine/threonine-protein kinase
MTEGKAPVNPGDVLAGKYRVERVLGVGGMGVVVAALHLELDQRVALKFLLPEAAARPDITTRFSREARAAAKIRNEHVARVTDVGTLESGAPYIVMEYLEGRDLSQIVDKHGPLPIQVAVDYVLQACLALAEAHAAGIIHRDLKPSNLFLAQMADGTEIIKVLDFGISKSLVPSPEGAEGIGALTKTAEVLGSPMYMSPEQLKAFRDVDARADLWGLGVILYELVTAKAPFDRGSIAEIFGAIIYEKAPPLSAMLPSVPPGFEGIVARCLEKEPADRYKNIADLAEALHSFGSHESKSSVQRISRLLQAHAGSLEISRPSFPVAAIAPPPSSSPGEAVTPGLPTGNSTRTSWGQPEEDAKPRSIGRIVALAAVPVVALAGVGLFVALSARKPAPSPGSDRAPAPTREIAEVPAVSAGPVVAPSAEIVALAPPSASASARPRQGKLPSGGAGVKRPGGRTTKEDPNGFGDRK